MRSHRLKFLENVGQLHPGVAYALEGRNASVSFGVGGIALALAPGREAVRIAFSGARAGARPVGEGPSGTRVSYFEGAPERWRTGARTFERVVYRELWPGIDLAFRAVDDRLKYEFTVRPGADPADIRLEYRGASRLAVTDRGELEVVAPAGTLVDERPVAFQERAGASRAVEAAYEVVSGPGGHVVRFRVGDYDRSRPLVIDPAVVVYSGLFGGSSSDLALDVAVDAAGSVYVVGGTYSGQADGFPVGVGPDVTFNPTGRPAPPPACDTQDAFLDAFVAKVRPDGGGFAYIGYIGGSCNQAATSVAVGSDGSAYVTGFTTSDQRTFPVRGGPRLTYGGGGYEGDAFVAKVSPDGTELVYAGYVGGSGDDVGSAIAVDAAGSAYVAGWTKSSNFPVVTGPMGSLGSQNGDAFVAKVRADGAGLVYSGYLGGNGEDAASGIAVDAAGSAYVTGYTSSTSGLPVVVGPSLTPSGNTDAFVGKLRPDGGGLVYLGYFGGDDGDAGIAVAVDAAGSAYVAGVTGSTEGTFPVLGGPDVTYNDAAGEDASDAFVMKLKPDGSGPVYSGFIGGADSDSATGIAVASDGSAFVSGATRSSEGSFPTVDAFDATFGGGTGLGDGFVAQVAPDGARLLMSTYVGGTENDMVSAVAVDAAGSVYVAGLTGSTETSFPIESGPGEVHNGLDDAFVMKLVVTGEGFERGAQILVNGSAYKTKANKRTPSTKLQSGKAGKIVKAGDSITVRNPNGSVSNAVTFAG